MHAEELPVECIQGTTYIWDVLPETLKPARPAADQQRCSGHPVAEALPEGPVPAAKEQLLAASAAAAAAAQGGCAGPVQAQPTAGRWAAPGGVVGPVPLLNEQ